MIYFQDIQFRYEGTISSEIGVKDINLIVHTGECVLLCGRSGCGKTTLTKLINGLIPNYFPGELSGNVQIDDENILGMPMYYLATKVGSVFQNPRTQFFNVDVDSEIAFGIENIAVVFDEPTSGLDYDSMEQVSGLIRELSKDKVIFVVTHDYEFVCQTCTRLIRFDHHTMTNDILLSQENEATILSLMGLGRNER